MFSGWFSCHPNATTLPGLNTSLFFFFTSVTMKILMVCSQDLYNNQTKNTPISSDSLVCPLYFKVYCLIPSSGTLVGGHYWKTSDQSRKTGSLNHLEHAGAPSAPRLSLLASDGWKCNNCPCSSLLRAQSRVWIHWIALSEFQHNVTESIRCMACPYPGDLALINSTVWPGNYWVKVIPK